MRPALACTAPIDLLIIHYDSDCEGMIEPCMPERSESKVSDPDERIAVWDDDFRRFT